MKKKSPAVLQQEYNMDLQKISDKGIMLDDSGKILVYILKEGQDGSMAYFFDKDSNAVRIHTSSFYRLLEEGKALRVAADFFEE